MDTTLNTDQPHTADCDTCGGSRVFDNEPAAQEWAADHADLGHVVNVEAA